MSFFHIRSRERAKYEAVILCSILNRFTTGRIPSDAKGATMAELDERKYNREHRRQNNIIFAVE